MLLTKYINNKVFDYIDPYGETLVSTARANITIINTLSRPHQYKLSLVDKLYSTSR